jgi:predicted nucleic acid-binding protein
MDVLADTNILIRRINRFDAQHSETRAALRILEERGDRVRIVPQNIVEFWNVAIRPVGRNGLGLFPVKWNGSPPALRIRSTCHRRGLRSIAGGKKLVAMHAVSGLKVYDARLVASALVYGVETLLTFNGNDFRCYPGIWLLHPRDFVQEK